MASAVAAKTVVKAYFISDVGDWPMQRIRGDVSKRDTLLFNFIELLI